MAFPGPSGERWRRRYLPGARGVALVVGGLVLVVAVALGLLRMAGFTPMASLVGELVVDTPTSLTVAIVMPPASPDDDFVQGTELAVREVNAHGGIDGLPVKLKFFPEDIVNQTSDRTRIVSNALSTAENVAATPNLLAVIGHLTSETALPASSIYNRRGVLFIATHATASSLTDHGFDYVLALQPTNADNAAMIAHHAVEMKLKRFVVLTDNTDYATETATLFRSWVTKAGGDILYRGALERGSRSVDKLLSFLMDNDVFDRKSIDAFFVASTSEDDIADFIKRARSLGLNQPILGTDNIFSNTIVRRVGAKLMQGVYGVSLYDERSASPQTMVFKRLFKEAYDHTPDQTAAVGYDVIRLLAYAVKGAGSRNPRKLSDWLHIMRFEKPFQGATGPIAFDANGLITDTDAFIVEFTGDHFHTIASYRKPLKWDTIDDAYKGHKDLNPNAPEQLVPDSVAPSVVTPDKGDGDSFGGDPDTAPHGRSGNQMQ